MNRDPKREVKIPRHLPFNIEWPVIQLQRKGWTVNITRDEFDPSHFRARAQIGMGEFKRVFVGLGVTPTMALNGMLLNEGVKEVVCPTT